MHKKDLRIIKTEKNIEKTLIKLLSQKSFKSITVQNILDEALINRTTFYNHYQDKYDLAEGMCRTIFNGIKEDVIKRFESDSTEDFFACVTHLYQGLLRKKERLLVLFSIHTETIHLYDDITNMLHDLYFQWYIKKQNGDEVMADYYARAYSSLVMTTIKWCLLNDFGYDHLIKNTDFFLQLKSLFKKSPSNKR